jgi:hypothetical protein
MSEPETVTELDESTVEDEAAVARRARAVSARLEAGEGVLSRPDLFALGYPRSAVDRIFRRCNVQDWSTEGDIARKPLITVKDFLEARDAATYGNDRVRLS